MRIALRELRRRPGRFTVAAVILTLIAILVMFLGGLLDGLTGSSTGALRAQKGELIVFSSTSRDSIVRSRIEPSTARQVEGVEGVKRAGGLGSVQLGARLSDSGPRDLFPVVLFGMLPLPDLLPADKSLAAAVRPLHRIAAWALLALIVLHAAAALKHHFIDRDGLLRRMWP